MSIRGQTVIITGAGSGIGEATARLFAEHGAQVVIVARSASYLYDVAKDIEAHGGIAMPIQGDVSITEDVERICKATADRFGRIDILVNNAGVGDYHNSTVITSDELWDKVISINLTGTFKFCREALKYMEAQGKQGSIINVSSGAGARANSGAAYTAAKFAVEGLTRNIAINYGGTGIRCNSIRPGITATRFTDGEEWERNFDAEFNATCNKHMNLTIGHTEAIDQAQGILFFADPDNRYITGQVFCIDGGSFL